MKGWESKLYWIYRENTRFEKSKSQLLEETEDWSGYYTELINYTELSVRHKDLAYRKNKQKF